MKLWTGILLCLMFVACSKTTPLTPHLPNEISMEGTYVFYLHGGVVQAQGIPAVSDYYGAYEYLNIVESLRSGGHYVVSEVRHKDTQELDYARQLSLQIDTLINAGVPPQNITVVGASLGAYIAMELAHIKNRQDLNYALLGLCSEYALGYFEQYREGLCGNFLSIYEASDSKSSCQSLLNHPDCKSGYREIRLDMGIDHAFLFKPYPEWTEPLQEWIISRKR